MTGKKKFRLKLNSRHIFFVVFSLVVLAYLFIRIIPERTFLLEKQEQHFFADATVYVFKDEEYIILQSDQVLDMLVEEGSNVSGSTVLSNDYAVGTEYIQEKIKALTFMINHNDVNTKSEIYARISAEEDKIYDYEQQLAEAVESENIDTQEEIKKKIASSEQQIEMLKEAQQYIFTTTAEMTSMRSEFQKLLNQSELPLTLGNLNFSIFGYISYHRSGYEDLLTINYLEDMEEGGFDMLDAYDPIIVSEPDQYIIRSIATDRMIIGIRVPKDEVISGEETVLQKKEDLTNTYNMHQEGGYYEFLFTRIDLLKKFPSMSILLPDGTEITGDVVGVIEEGDDKILILAVREDLALLWEQNIFEAQLDLFSSDFYIVPETAVVTVGDRSYITVLTDYNSVKSFVEVMIYDTIGDELYLRVSENPSLQEDMKILLKGEMPDDLE